MTTHQNSQQKESFLEIISDVFNLNYYLNFTSTLKLIKYLLERCSTMMSPQRLDQ